MKTFLQIFPAVLVTLIGGPAVAQLTIQGGAFVLQPNTAGQEIEINVTGGDAVQGLNFSVTVEDGFPDFGTVDGPNITGVDIINGTVFGANNTGQNTTASFEQAWVVSTTTSAGTVSASGLLATVTIDTTGIFSGSGPFQLSFADPTGGPSDFAGISATIEPASIEIAVPEPSSFAVVVAGTISLLFSGCRRRQ